MHYYSRHKLVTEEKILNIQVKTKKQNWNSLNIIAPKWSKLGLHYSVYDEIGRNDGCTFELIKKWTPWKNLLRKSTGGAKPSLSQARWSAHLVGSVPIYKILIYNTQLYVKCMWTWGKLTKIDLVKRQQELLVT